MTYTKHGLPSLTNILSWSPVLSVMSSLMETSGLAPLPSVTSAAKPQLNLTLSPSCACALPVAGSPGYSKLKPSTAQSTTTHRPGYIVFSPTSSRLARSSTRASCSGYTTFGAEIRGYDVAYVLAALVKSAGGGCYQGREHVEVWQQW